MIIIRECTHEQERHAAADINRAWKEARVTRMRRFTMFSRDVLDSETNEPLLEGVVFTDKTVVIRWYASAGVAVWPSMEDMLDFVGPDYSKLLWHD